MRPRSGDGERRGCDDQDGDDPLHACRVVGLPDAPTRSRRDLGRRDAAQQAAARFRISARRISSTWRAPSSPSAASPQSTARAASTARAPSASALTTSAPRRMPPSTSTSIAPVDRLDHLGQRVDRRRRRRRAGGRRGWRRRCAAAPCSHASARVLGGQHALDDSGMPASRRDSLQVVPGERRRDHLERLGGVTPPRPSDATVMSAGSRTPCARRARGCRAPVRRSSARARRNPAVAGLRDQVTRHAARRGRRRAGTSAARRRRPPRPVSTVASVERHMIVPASRAARAVATSPSGCATRWNATGATSSGIETSCAEHRRRRAARLATSTSMRGRSTQRRYASTLSRSVTSSPAPPA